jgi:hypothetical protein
MKSEPFFVILKKFQPPFDLTKYLSHTALDMERHFPFVFAEPLNGLLIHTDFCPFSEQYVIKINALVSLVIYGSRGAV